MKVEDMVNGKFYFVYIEQIMRRGIKYGKSGKVTYLDKVLVQAHRIHTSLDWVVLKVVVDYDERQIAYTKGDMITVFKTDIKKIRIPTQSELTLEMLR
jgi:hypothetical protein